MNTKAIFEIGAKVTGQSAIKGLEKDIRAAGSAGDNLKRSLFSASGAVRTLIAALPVAGFAAWIKSSVNFADNLQDVSERTGVAVETLSQYAIAAQLGGSSIEEFASGINKLNKSIVESDNKTSKQAMAFKALGVETRDAAGNLRDTQDIIEEIADVFASTEDGAEKSAIAMDLFGKSGADLIPVLNQGSEGLTKFNKGVSEEFSKAASAFNDELDIMKNNLGKFGNTIAEAVLPPLTNMLKLLNNISEVEVQQKSIIEGFYSRAGVDISRIGAVNPEFGGFKGLNTKTFGDTDTKGKLKYSGADQETVNKVKSATDALKEYIRAQNEELKTLQMEAEYIGKTSVEIEKMKDARKIDQEILAKTKDLSESAARTYKDQAEAIKQQRQEVIQSNYDAQRTYAAGASNFFSKYVEAATDSAALIQNALTNAFDAVENSLVDFFTTGKLGIKDLANTIIKELIRVQIQKNIMAPLASLFGGGSGVSNFFSSFFADGGVMTGSGPMPLRKYASGGIANSPQMAIYGEGSTPEAYVPLPDGRRIPVAMQGGGSTNVSVVVNMDGATTTRGDTPSGIDLGNLIAGVVKNTLVNEKRPGGMLATA